MCDIEKRKPDSVIESKYDIETNTLYLNFPNKELNLVVNGDFNLVFDGEINCITNGENICFDTIGGQFHINSRWGKKIRDLPESIEYRENIKKQIEENTRENEHNHVKDCPLFYEIIKLKKELEELKNELSSS